MMKKFCLTLLMVLWAAGNLQASGFGVFTQGAKGLAQSNAVTAHASGPSSLYFNPALLPRITGTRVEVGATLIDADREFNSAASGLTEGGADSLKSPGTFYATRQFSDRLSAGLGVYFPFGLATEWERGWEGRYIATRSEIATVNINPALAYRVNDQLCVAAGLDALYLDAELERQVNSTLLGFMLNPPDGLGTLPDAKQKFSGNGWGFGYNLGVLLKLGEHLDFGASYRSRIDVTADGDLEFTVPPGAAVLQPLLTDTGGDSDIRLPRQAAFGLAWNIAPPLTVEIGARWEDWSSTNQVLINLDQAVLGQTVDVTPRDWNDTWAFNIGGAYRLNETVTLLAGYLYSDNPVPDHTFDPSLPDADAHLFTIGTGLSFGNWTVDLAYGFEHHEDRDKNNPIGSTTGSTANGTYSANIQLAAASIGYRF
ncbi:MAG TPA: outer membrane protein transport protein [Geopsychrobacteraceae bacterium]|jgi:long-chain fatty acid transport protein